MAPRGAVPSERGGFEPHFASDLPKDAHSVIWAVPCFRAGLSRLSCVADFRIATAFYPCGGAGLSRLPEVFSVQGQTAPPMRRLTMASCDTPEGVFRAVASRPSSGRGKKERRKCWSLPRLPGTLPEVSGSARKIRLERPGGRMPFPAAAESIIDGSAQWPFAAPPPECPSKCSSCRPGVGFS